MTGDDKSPGFNIPVPVGCHDRNAFNEPSAFDGPSYQVETARKHRYVLDVLEPLGTRSDGILLFLEKCTRPAPEFDEITIHNGQDEIYRPGKHRWRPVEFTFYEKLQGDSGSSVNQATEMLYQWWAESVAIVRESKLVPAADIYKNAELQMLDGIGNSVWTYFIYDCWPQKISPADLSYSDSDISVITVTLRYNKAEEKQGR